MNHQTLDLSRLQNSKRSECRGKIYSKGNGSGITHQILRNYSNGFPETIKSHIPYVLTINFDLLKDIKVALSIYWFNWQSDQNWILVEKLSQNIEGGSAAEQMQGIESLKGRQYGHKMPSVIHKLTQKAITAEWIHWNVHVLFTDTRKPYQSRSSIKKPVEESQNCGFPWPSHHIPSLSVHCYLEGFHNVALAQRR